MPTKSPITTTLAHAGDVRDRRLVDREQRAADEVAGVDAGIRRPHDAAMQHAGHAHVVHEDRSPVDLGRDVHARHRRADDAVLGRPSARVRSSISSTCRPRPARRARRGRPSGAARGHRARQQLGRTPSARPPAHSQARACAAACAQRQRVDLDRRAGDRRALIRHARGVAEHHPTAPSGTSSSSATICANAVCSRCRGRRGRPAPVDAAVVREREQHLGPSAGLPGTSARLARAQAAPRAASRTTSSTPSARGTRARCEAGRRAAHASEPSRSVNCARAAPRPGSPGACRNGTGCATARRAPARRSAADRARAAPRSASTMPLRQ